MRFQLVLATVAVLCWCSSLCQADVAGSSAASAAAATLQGAPLAAAAAAAAADKTPLKQGALAPAQPHQPQPQQQAAARGAGARAHVRKAPTLKLAKKAPAPAPVPAPAPAPGPVPQDSTMKEIPSASEIVKAVQERRAAEEAKTNSPPAPEDPAKKFPSSWDIFKAVQRRKAIRDFEQKPKNPADPRGPERDAANSVMDDIMDAVADQEFDKNKQQQQQQPVVVVVPVDPRLDHPAAKETPLAVNQKPKPDHPLSKQRTRRNDPELEASSPKSPESEQQQRDLPVKPRQPRYEPGYDLQDPEPRHPEIEHPSFERMIDHRGAEYDVPDLPHGHPEPQVPDLPTPDPRPEPRMTDLPDMPVSEPHHALYYEESLSSRDDGIDMPDLPYLLPILPLPEDLMPYDESSLNGPDLPGPESWQPSYGPNAYHDQPVDDDRQGPEDVHDQQRTDGGYAPNGLPDQYRSDMSETDYNSDLDLSTSQPRDLPEGQGAQGGYRYGYGSQGLPDRLHDGPGSGSEPRPDDDGPHTWEGVDKQLEGHHVREQPLYEPYGEARSVGTVHAATSELQILYSGDGRDAGPEELGGGLVWTVSGGSGATPGTDLQSPDGAYGPWSIDVEQGFKWSRAAHMAPFFSLEGRPERPLSVRIKGKLGGVLPGTDSVLASTNSISTGGKVPRDFMKDARVVIKQPETCLYRWTPVDTFETYECTGRVVAAEPALSFDGTIAEFLAVGVHQDLLFMDEVEVTCEISKCTSPDAML